MIPLNYGQRDMAEYVAAANDQLFVSVMIEKAEAYLAIEKICAIPGLVSRENKTCICFCLAFSRQRGKNRHRQRDTAGEGQGTGGATGLA